MKTYKSLKGKATKEVDSLLSSNLPSVQPKAARGDALSEDSVIRMLDKKIKDRAGVRVLVYFPDDVSNVAKAIEASRFLEFASLLLSASPRTAKIGDRKTPKNRKRDGNP